MKTKFTSHILDVLEQQERLLSITGYWPRRNASLAYNCRIFISWTIDLSFQYFLFLEFFKTITNAEYKELTELLSMMVSFVSYVSKHFFFNLQAKTFLNLMDKLQDPMLHDFPAVCDSLVAKENKSIFKMSRVFRFFAYNMVTVSSVKPFLNGGLALQFSAWELGPWFYPFHLYQIVNMANGCFNNVGLDCVAMSLMSIGCMQFDILKAKLINCRQWAGLTSEEIDDGITNNYPEMDPQFDRTVNQYLGTCVQHHLKILELLADIETIFSRVLLIQFAASVLAICNTWFQFMLERTIIKMMFLICYGIALLCQIGVYCLSGDEVMLKSQEVKDACYFSDWYQSNNDVRKSLLLIMERSKRPNLITAGKISIVNMVTYTGLLRMSYSYFALMNQLYGQ